MDFRAAAFEEFASRASALAERSALVGLDGFIDTIVTPVGRRLGPGEEFEPIPTIAEFARRIAAAAGKSTNLEFCPRLEKVGGNGPLMAQALLAAGITVRYIGALGRPEIHPLLREFAAQTQAVSLCAPARTTAVEFADGKLMLGTLASLDEITVARLAEAMGESALDRALGRADLLALTNWTMLPHMTEIFAALSARLAALPPRPDRIVFFDLADPEKRTDADLRAALAAIAEFERCRRVVLGLNLKEAQQVGRVLALPAQAEDEAGVAALAGAIRDRLQLAVVAVHPTKFAAAATAGGAWHVPGPWIERPRLTTGAGDHFNAGFAAALLLGCTPPTALTLGVATSGFYVRHGRSPARAEILAFLQTWS